MDFGFPTWQVVGKIFHVLVMFWPVYLFGIAVVLIKELAQQKIENNIRTLNPDFSGPQYRVRSSLVTRSEAAFLVELRRQLPNGFQVFPKMRVADVLETQRGDGYIKRRNKVLPKHVDFTVADFHFRPIFSIELNGKSHHSVQQQESDSAKHAAFKSAGFPLEVVEVGSRYEQEIARLLKTHLVS